MRPALDLSLYLIVGPSHVDGDPVPLIRAAVAGGVTLIQLRDKTSSTGAMVNNARAIKAALRGTGVPLLINDRADVAVASGADGLHVGRDDLTPADARRIIGPNGLIGVTVKTPEEARSVDPGLVDYASIGGVFQTSSKVNPDAPIGLSGLRAQVAMLTAGAPGLPRCAIAGIDDSNAADVIAAGVDGICVVSAIASAADPCESAQRLKSIVDAAKRDHERALA